MKINLKESLKMYGLKQTFIADKMGVHVNQVTRWVKGIQEPSPRNYNKLIKILSKYRDLEMFG